MLSLVFVYFLYYIIHNMTTNTYNSHNNVLLKHRLQTGASLSHMLLHIYFTKFATIIKLRTRSKYLFPVDS